LQSKPQPYGIPDALSHKTRTDYRAHYADCAANSSRDEEDVGSIQGNQSIKQEPYGSLLTAAVVG